MRLNAKVPQGTAPGIEGASDEEGGLPLCTARRAAWGQGLPRGLGDKTVLGGRGRVFQDRR